MPLNLLKKYNQLLDLLSFSDQERKASLKGVFNRDIVNNANFVFRTKKIFPTTAEGQDTMERFFTHLTTVVVDKQTNKREYDHQRHIAGTYLTNCRLGIFIVPFSCSINTTHRCHINPPVFI